MIGPGSVPRRRGGVELVKADGQNVMLDASGNVARGLNETAARVWELVDGRRTVAQIAVLLGGEGGVGSEVDVEGEVLEFLRALEARGLIEL